MKKLVILLILLCAAGAAAWFIYREAPSGPEDKAVLYGNVDLRQVDLAFLISERIDSVLVDEGDTVVPGQKLATLETVRLQQAVDEARQTTEAARQNYLRVKNGPRAEEIAQARSNVQAAEATLNNAAVRSKRLVALADTKSISRQEADDAVASQQVAAANLDVARKQLELLLAGSRVEDIAQSLAQYNQAKANLVIREQNLKDAVLYAPATPWCATGFWKRGTWPPRRNLFITSP